MQKNIFWIKYVRSMKIMTKKTGDLLRRSLGRCDYKNMIILILFNNFQALMG